MDHSLLKIMKLKDWKNYKSYERIRLCKNLKLGTKGCIVLKYTENDFEVEFFDDNGETIDVYTISKEYLEVYWTQ